MSMLTREEVEAWPALGPMNLKKERVLALLARAETAEIERDTAKLERDKAIEQVVRREEQLKKWTDDRELLARDLESARASEKAAQDDRAAWEAEAREAQAERDVARGELAGTKLSHDVEERSFLALVDELKDQVAGLDAKLSAARTEAAAALAAHDARVIAAERKKLDEEWNLAIAANLKPVPDSLKAVLDRHNARIRNAALEEAAEEIESAFLLDEDISAVDVVRALKTPDNVDRMKEQIAEAQTGVQPEGDPERSKP